MEDQRVWGLVLDQLKRECHDQSVELWFGPVRFIGRSENKIRLQVPNQFCQQWIEEKFGDRLKEVVGIYFGPESELEFSLSEEPISGQDFIEVKPLDTVPWQTRALQANLNPKYTFENFVVGPCNQFAHAASKAVAETDSVKYNPLFIYGGVGLGKTHLLNAIGNRILERKNGVRVISVQAESFLNDLINCIFTDRIQEFRTRFRKNCDVLLIDDIEILCGKERTQEEFFYTFNELFESGKQIVMSSDRVPAELPELTERLRSRFESGMIVDIQAPEYETKLAIIKKKAEESKVIIPDEVCEYLAKNVRSNIRKLEGCIIRICAYASFSGQPVNLDLAKHLLNNILIEGGKSLSAEAVLKEVSKNFGIRIQDIKGEKRMQKFVLPRQVAMYIFRRYLKQSYPEIGEIFEGKTGSKKGKDHSTVIHSCRKIEALIDKDTEIRKRIEMILNALGIKEELE